MLKNSFVNKEMGLFKFSIARFCIACLIFSLFNCKENASRSGNSDVEFPKSSLNFIKGRDSQPTNQPSILDLEELADTSFVRLVDYSNEFAFDLRYATENNFLNAAVYPCAECYLRAKTARALIAANSEFKKLGYRIRFYDCYRPNSVQYKMWELVPNPQYVADPVKGSIHNKGGAVDITLETLDGIVLDMGTDFDYFGKRAYHDNLNLPSEILENRRILKEVMERHGFWSIRTEWWHYNLSAGSNDAVANFSWPCTTS